MRRRERGEAALVGRREVQELNEQNAVALNERKRSIANLEEEGAGSKFGEA